MRVLSRSGPALLLGVALLGCDSGSSDSAPINPNLPQVTLEVPGMT
jgi:hypothetical protein